MVRKISCSQGEGLICIHQFSLVVFYCKKEGEILFYFLFSMCAHHVPKVFLNIFLKMFPIAPWFYSIWFAQSLIPMYINWKGGLWAKEYIYFYFAIEVQRGAPIGECPVILKQLMISRWLWVFNKKLKNYESTHELLYMNHNRYEIPKTSFNFAILVWIEPYGL